ncbi:MAG TPA: Xaa-Pro peptidase family protein [Opitutaceae bacterium]|nr:Xaa-Pro peptidase family protein [Opitutaceae bacterium]HPG16973.1 Xaa-Pro peptidase family protein [Opitutaceae bacterium]HPN99726.1 Xaa-Pro peptidase family protein [Opitutaceae bacterium]
MTQPAILLYADSERSADMLYLGRIQVPDAFVAFVARGKKYAVLGALELGRARKESAFDKILPLETYLQRARKRWPDRKPGPAEVVALVAAEFRVKNFYIPDDFPAGLATRISQLGVGLTIVTDAIFPEREVKTPREIAAIREGNRCSAAGLAAAERLLRASKIKGRQLLHDGKPLTSEKLRRAIEVACLEAGSLSHGTIAAGGDQACDPHCVGHGPLRANELIVVDVFPRVQTTGYHGDMTRTFLRGHASDAQRALVEAVRAAQFGAMQSIRAGVNGRDIHHGVIAEFEQRGYATKHTAKGSVGFFHGTGHGLGLAVHELPRMSTVDHTLLKDSVVTVEPGLYYPGLGGCRIEDVVQVTARGAKQLSDFHYDWELR